MVYKANERKFLVSPLFVSSFSVIGLSAILLILGTNVVYGQLSTEEEQEKFGLDDDGKKKSYTDCEGYEDYTESKGMSKEDADYNTDAVDIRIVELKNEETFNPSGFTDEEQEQLDCLRAIRTIEINAMADFTETMGDLKTFAESYKNILELQEKYSDN